MFLLKSFTFALLVLLSFCVAGFAANVGDDKDPFPGCNDPFWTTNGAVARMPVLVDGNGKLQIFTTQWFYASKNLQANHDIDRKQILHGHWHYRDDFPQASNQYNVNLTGQANAYWDVVFQNGIQPGMDRYGDATTQYNCFAFALDYGIKRGTYNYWIDDSNANLGPFGGAGEATAAFVADASPALQAKVAVGDVLLYGFGNNIIHASRVFAGINCGPPRTPQFLSWKYGTSGWYDFPANSFNTPKYIFNQKPVAGNPLPAGTWYLAGGGSELPNGPLNPNGKFPSLYPPGKVWQAVPKQN